MKLKSTALEVETLSTWPSELQTEANFDQKLLPQLMFGRKISKAYTTHFNRILKKRSLNRTVPVCLSNAQLTMIITF